MSVQGVGRGEAAALPEQPATMGMCGYARAVVAGAAPPRLVHAEHRAPLALQRLLRPEPDVAHLMVLSPTGGVLQGDELDIDVTARDRATLRVATQSATRMHASPETAAHQHVRLRASGGAYLEHLPRPTILFDGARLAQRYDVEADGDATVVLADALVSGRLRRGERYGFASFASRLEIRVDGEPVVVEAGEMAPGRCVPGPVVTGGQPAVASLYAVGPATADLVAPAQAAVAERVAALDGFAGVTPLRNRAGLAVKVAASDRRSAQAVLEAAWRVVRTGAIGPPPVALWP